MEGSSPKNRRHVSQITGGHQSSQFGSGHGSLTSSWTQKRGVKKLDKFLESNGVTIFMSIITIYALFADDIRQLIDDKSIDDGFYITTLIVLGFFFIELCLLSIAKPGYFCHFFFWLDFISTVSLIFDVGWISEAIFDTDSGAAGVAGASQLARAGRASRVGTRAGRIVRIIRLVRLIRIVKLYKHAQTKISQSSENINKSDDLAMLRRQASMVFDSDGNPKKTASRRDAAESKSKTNFEKSDSLGKMERMDSIEEKAKEDGRDLNGENGEDIGKVIERSIERRLSKKASIVDINYPRKESSKQLPKKHSINIDDIEVKEKEKNPSFTNFEKKQQEAAKQELAQSDDKEMPDQEIELPQETNVGRKLSDLTTKRVITLVMSVMLSIPIFDIETYVSEIAAGESGLKAIYSMSGPGDEDAFSLANETYITENTDIRIPLFKIQIGTEVIYETLSEEAIRTSEKTYYNVKDEDDEIAAYSVFDKREDTRLDAILGIVRTFFVTCILAIGALLFSKDANDLVLAPIEMMISKVQRIAQNPLTAALIEEEEAEILEKAEQKGDIKTLKKKKEEGNYETNILEKTILKLGALLALGFGEAGSEIIAKNMSKTGEVDPIIPGKKVMAIFGFCDIRNFTDATEVLQEGVMIFVNEIAEIVHGTIYDFSGSANKNIGDAFLLVWKMPPDEYYEDPVDKENLVLKQSRVVQSLADMSIISFIKILARIKRSKKLQKYAEDEKLQERLPNYSVKMGFGLHVGWAIEGAIGSEYKIDASYLSPNVNIASRLEAATKQYGVPLLISGQVYKIASPEVKKQLRLIDKVALKGSVVPVEIYTCDLEISKLPLNKKEKDMVQLTAKEKRRDRVENRKRRNELKNKAFRGQVKLGKLFQTDKDILMMREPYTSEFYSKFSEGMGAYLSGNWSKAHSIFERTMTMIPGHKDGPSQTHLRFIESFEKTAPPEWHGFKVLNEK